MTTTACDSALGVDQQVRRAGLERASCGRPSTPSIRIDVTSEATASFGIVTTVAPRERGPRDGGRPVPGLPAVPSRGVVAVDDLDLDLGRLDDRRQHAVAGQHAVGRPGEQRREPVDGANRHSSSRPFGHGEVGDVERRRRATRGTASGSVPAPPRCGSRRPCAPGEWSVDEGVRRGGRHQPTAPSICSSMRRLSSRAYSMGSSRAMGSTNPRTIIAMASVSVMPRDIR